MLQPVTRKMTDESAGSTYQFTFYCDLCGQPWRSFPVCGQPDVRENDLRKRGRRYDHEAAYERANLEALRHFNRCPVCKRWVCDDCFLLLHDGDVCRECAAIERRTGQAPHDNR